MNETMQNLEKPFLHANKRLLIVSWKTLSIDRSDNLSSISPTKGALHRNHVRKGLHKDEVELHALQANNRELAKSFDEFLIVELE